MPLPLLMQDCFEMLDIGHSTEGLPQEVHSIPGPRVQRQVLLRPSLPSGTVVHGQEMSFNTWKSLVMLLLTLPNMKQLKGLHLYHPSGIRCENGCGCFALRVTSV